MQGHPVYTPEVKWIEFKDRPLTIKELRIYQNLKKISKRIWDEIQTYYQQEENRTKLKNALINQTINYNLTSNTEDSQVYGKIGKPFVYPIMATITRRNGKENQGKKIGWMSFVWCDLRKRYMTQMPSAQWPMALLHYFNINLEDSIYEFKKGNKQQNAKMSQ